jgi:hypothetical protein
VVEHLLKALGSVLGLKGKEMKEIFSWHTLLNQNLTHGDQGLIYRYLASTAWSLKIFVYNLYPKP